MTTAAALPAEDTRTARENRWLLHNLFHAYSE